MHVFTLNMKAQKRACFHVNFKPSLHHNGRGSIYIHAHCPFQSKLAIMACVVTRRKCLAFFHVFHSALRQVFTRSYIHESEWAEVPVHMYVCIIHPSSCVLGPGVASPGSTQTPQTPQTPQTLGFPHMKGSTHTTCLEPNDSYNPLGAVPPFLHFVDS